jgi:hypothetical protein
MIEPEVRKTVLLNLRQDSILATDSWLLTFVYFGVDFRAVFRKSIES